MNRSEKEQIIAEVKEKVVRAKAMYFADFTGITVEQVNDLRREFRKSNVDYRVVKNTLARKALESATGYDKVIDKLVGATGIAFGYDDPVAPARIIKKFQEKHENKLKVKVCVLETQVFDGSQLAEIAKLPSRGEVIAGIIGSIQSPIVGVLGAVNAVLRDLVSVIDAIEKKKAA
jgi:large subunit ribosomal protein L10